MFADLDILPLTLQVILYVIPYTHTMLSAIALFLSDYATMVRSIAYISLITVIVLAIVARIFSTEKIITARLSLDRLRIGTRKKSPE
jgi:ABC-2 type transport system permease protein